ncbi:SDR family oxidoreductase [Amycolatopsis suaedae]|uniref:SDR family oxidoreductase n=1 Tax=Amycolatopsis suaedae TaxID=2510978 RepID=A0A4Q7J6N5_9PSEU|nr:SDR family oxidoreductase [Amycolatopsis suaedae]RZQ61983.1 SDR family oxidoreductase [Amycolatopsis suaedae]
MDAPRTVAITGAARGIGLATATAFAERGVRVAIGDRDTALAEQAAATIPGAAAFPLDVTDAASFAGFLDRAEAELGPIDVLVNNAGLMVTGEFLAETAAELMIDVNLRGVLIGCRLAGERFARRGGGTIVNIASMAGMAGFPGIATYSATKFGVVGLSQALRAELRPLGVRVSAVLPGIVHTELSAGVRLPASVERFASCEPADIARAVLRVIATGRATVYVPGRLSLLLRGTLLMPEPLQRLIAGAMGSERLYLNVDQATRDAYHRRATG